MNYSITVKCPNCGTENHRAMKASATASREMWTCDSEAGGCDKEFVVELTLGTPTARVFKLEEVPQ